jgi:hypothetical protein
LVLFFIPIFMYSRIRDPVLFYPPGPGSGINHPGSATLSLSKSKIGIVQALTIDPLLGAVASARIPSLCRCR